MLGLDTNVLVRFLTKDDAVQFKQAENLLRHHCSVTKPGWISVIVLCELVWVLSRGYGYDKVQISSVIEHLLRTPFLVLEDESLVRNALKAWQASKLDFPDSLIAERNRRVGCTTTYTFDAKASAADGFSPVPRT
jgi:predicted nucleic-acid-binding protein